MNEALPTRQLARFVRQSQWSDLPATVQHEAALAAELAPAIRANTVCPGLVDTPMAVGVQSNVGNYTLRRLAQPIEIAQAILFLTSAESSYVTGAALAVDGGRSFH